MLKSYFSTKPPKKPSIPVFCFLINLFLSLWHVSHFFHLSAKLLLFSLSLSLSLSRALVRWLWFGGSWVWFGGFCGSNLVGLGCFWLGGVSQQRWVARLLDGSQWAMVGCVMGCAMSWGRWVEVGWGCWLWVYGGLGGEGEWVELFVLWVVLWVETGGWLCRGLKPMGWGCWFWVCGGLGGEGEWVVRIKKNYKSLINNILMKC